MNNCLKTTLFVPDFNQISINNKRKKNININKNKNNETKKLELKQKSIKFQNYFDINKENKLKNEKLKKYLNEEELKNYNPNFRLDISISSSSFENIKNNTYANKNNNNFLNKINKKKEIINKIEIDDIKKLKLNKVNNIKFKDKINHINELEIIERKKKEKLKNNLIKESESNNNKFNYPVRKNKNHELKKEQLFDKEYFLKMKNDYINLKKNEEIEDIESDKNSLIDNNEDSIEEIESESISLFKEKNENINIKKDIMNNSTNLLESDFESIDEGSKNELKNISCGKLELSLEEKIKIKEKVRKEIKWFGDNKRKKMDFNEKNIKKLKYEFENAYYNRQIKKAQSNIKDIKKKINKIKKYF